MKIAYLGIKGLPSKGGVERVVEAVVQRLAGRHELTVYCNSRYTPPDTRLPGVRLVRIPTLPGKHLQPISLLGLSTLHAVLMGNYHLVHIHNTEACFAAPLLLGRYRVIATSHGKAYTRDKWGRLARVLLRLNDYAFARFPHLLTSVSRPLAEEYKRRYRKLVHYLPNGVDGNPPLDSGAAAATLRAHGVDRDYVLFAAGRMDPTKGCHLLLPAFARLECDLQLAVVGDLTTVPAYGENLRRMADRRVRFIPFVESKAELFGILRAARLFVFPSLVEAMSMILLEAASLGVPILCSAIPENAAVLEDQALYFRSGDVDDLATKLAWAIHSPEAMQSMGRAAQERVRQSLSWDAIAGQYEQLYHRTLARREE